MKCSTFGLGLTKMYKPMALSVIVVSSERDVKPYTIPRVGREIFIASGWQFQSVNKLAGRLFAFQMPTANFHVQYICFNCLQFLSVFLKLYDLLIIIDKLELRSFTRMSGTAQDTKRRVPPKRIKKSFLATRVLLDLQKCILSDAIGICSVIHNPWIWCLPFLKKRNRGTQHQFSENICSEHDLISISGTYVVTFLACLPPLGFSNI